MSPLSAVGWDARHDVVAVEDARVDHRLAPHPEHEQVAVAAEVGGDGDHLFDVLRREHAGTGGHVADERHVAHGPAVDVGAGARFERDLDRAGLARVAAQVALVLERGEVRVHGGR